MKYFIDTEFLEGTQKTRVLETLKPLKLHITLFVISFIFIAFSTPYLIPILIILLNIIYNFISFKRDEKPTIDLISIGIVAEDGREYYSISKDFNLDEAWNRFDWKETSLSKKHMGFDKEKEYWIRENVLKPIFMELTTENILDGMDFSYKNMKFLINQYGKTNKEIAKEICSFIDYRWVDENDKTKGLISPCDGSCEDYHVHTENVKFYAYYADYDWVAFCWLFGKMMDLPKGFPKYCMDLKQTLDEKINSIIGTEFITFNTTQFEGKKTSSRNFHDYEKLLKTSKNYPKQENEHSAIHDARWNKKLYDFLKTI